MSSLWALGLTLPWLWALGLGLLPRRFDGAAWGLALTGALATALAVTLSLAMPVEPLRLAWMPSLGWDWLVLRDGLTVLFALLACWIAVLVVLFAGGYMPHAQAEAGGYRRDAAFYALLAAFTGAMLGVVSAGNMVQLYLFWELTGLASFLLIGFWHHEPAARYGAVKSLMLTIAGGLALLLGLLLLAGLTGQADLPGLLADSERWRTAPWLNLPAALVVAGALAKSAQLPFSSWLPGAMAAPTPVSAYLHSSTLVAAGVYLLARFFPILSPAPAWEVLLVVSGGAGGVLAGLAALRQTEIKGLLAYSTISQYGFIFLAFGLASPEGAKAGLYAFFIHALIKAGLFLVAGAATALTGEKRLSALGGLAHTNPVLAAMAVVLALSLGGVPALGGFYYKEELLHAAYGHQAWVLLAAMLFGGFLTFLYMMRFLTEVFFGHGHHPQPRPPLSWRMGLPIALLTVAAIGAGLLPNELNETVLDPAIASVLQAPSPYTVELHAGGVLLMSLGVLAFGGAVWALWQRGWVSPQWVATLPERLVLGGRWLVCAYDRLSRWVLTLQNGNLRRYLRIEIALVLVLVAICWVPLGTPVWKLSDAVHPAETAMLGVSVLAAGATVWLRRHVLAVVALTISGYSLAVVFAFMHAPDVALAQVLVETLATFSIVLALRQSRQIEPQRTRILSAGKRDWGRWAIAGGTGLVVGGGTFFVAAEPPIASIGDWYANNGFVHSGLFDLVTAILTDFRALDTAIEILVFTATALAVIGLFRQREQRHE